ncbi:delta-like protein A isoform X2 [Lineus longissimus]|uniref:delta-like protein A isoform X2 n=1 Tax=Lineus longissimus TaxID=88925 RepID=UPI002B4CBEC6
MSDWQTPGLPWFDHTHAMSKRFTLCLCLLLAYHVASSSVTTVNGKQTVTGSPQEDTETPYSTTPFTDAPTTTPEPKPDPCLEDPYPCDNGGWCMPLARNASFGCICKGEWTGRTCDKKKVCDCNNGGACVSFQGQSSCMCPHQWKGEICTLKRSICEMYEPCNNSAICSGDHLLYSCSCTEQWTGTNCSEPKVCYPSRCSGHGLCEEILNGTDWFCNCFRGWRGDTCNQQSECDLKCRHGECVNGTETCVCKTGFKGKFCDLGISANTRPTARAPMGPWYSYPAYVALAGVGVIIVIMLFTICVMAWYLRISTSDKPDFHRTAKNDREKIINNRHDKPRKQIGFAFDHENKMDDEAIMY